MSSATSAAESTLGALLVGTFISIYLFGILTVQVHIYYKTYTTDAKPLKLLVALVWLLELGHTICTTQAIYVAAIVWYGDPDKLAKLPAGIDLIIAFASPLTVAVQLFYTNRVRLVLGSIYVPLVLCFLAACHVIGSFILVALMFKSPTIAEFNSQWGWLCSMLLGITVFIDVAVASILVVSLYRRRKRAFKNTARLLDRLIWWTIQTGVFTSIITVSSLITLQAMKSDSDSFIWFTIYICLGKVYSNSMMVGLNARKDLRDDLGHVFEMGTQLPLSNLRFKGINSGAIEVNVCTSTTQHGLVDSPVTPQTPSSLDNGKKIEEGENEDDVGVRSKYSCDELSK